MANRAQSVYSFPGIQQRSAQPSQHRSGQAVKSQTHARLAQLSPMIVPELSVTVVSHHTDRQEVIVLADIPTQTAVKLLIRKKIPPMRHEVVQVTSNECIHLLGDCSPERSWPQSLVSQDLVDKTEVTVLKKQNTGFHVRVQVCFVIEGIRRPDKI